MTGAVAVLVHGEGSREGYRDMESFIASVEQPDRCRASEPSRSEAAARFAALRMSSDAPPRSLSGGTHWPRSASAAERDHGSPQLATACCRLDRRDS